MDIITRIEEPFFAEGVKKFGWHLTIKAAMEALGIMNRHERLPMLALSDEDAATVGKLIASFPIEEVLADSG